MGRALRTVVRGGVHLRVLQQVLFGRLLVGSERLQKPPVLQLQFDFGTIFVLGHTGLSERFLPLLVGVVVLLHLIDVSIDLGAVNRDAALIGTLLDKLALNVGVDHFLTHGFGRVAVLCKPVAPRILIGHAHLGADALDVLGHRVLGNGHVANRSRHSPAIARRLIAACAGSEAPDACSRQPNGAHGFHDVRLFHMTLPSIMRRPRTTICATCGSSHVMLLAPYFRTRVKWGCLDAQYIHFRFIDRTSELPWRRLPPPEATLATHLEASTPPRCEHVRIVSERGVREFQVL